MSRHPLDSNGPTREAPDPHPVAAAREGLRLSREGLAFKAHVSVKTIERIERGETTPHRNTRESIARVLRCKAHELWPELEAAA